MADNEEQIVCVKFCFLLVKSTAGTVLMLQEVFKEEGLNKAQVYAWNSRFNRIKPNKPLKKIRLFLCPPRIYVKFGTVKPA